jgi:hypothetical protein
MDPNNPVVKLCADGMQAEFAGRLDEARDLFHQAWEAATDDYEACIAAHFMARHQPGPEDVLHWHRVALDRADAVGDERVRGFYPSLYLNMGYGHETLGQLTEAKQFYTLAAERVGDLPDDAYGETVRGGIAAAQARLKSIGVVDC